MTVTLALQHHSSCNAEPAAWLQLELPPSYPDKAPAQVTAVASACIGRQGERACAQRLQQLADSYVGQESLCQVVEAFMAEIQHGSSTSSSAAAAAGASLPASVNSHETQAEAQLGLALLRLDHMRNSTAYSRTVRRWAAELGLTGRLLFCSGSKPGGGSAGGSSSGGSTIILILLVGREEAINEYLVRQRTRVVDVDSKGRVRSSGFCQAACLLPWLDMIQKCTLWDSANTA
jgi:hypothetical protein